MNKSSRVRPAPPRRRRKHRHPKHTKLLLLGAAVLGCLLIGARQGPADNASAAAPTLTITQQPGQSAPVTQPPQPSAAPERGAPAVPAGDWRLQLVNPWNPLPEGYAPTLTQLKNGHSVDERCYPDLQAMMDACRAEGLRPVICSSYRSQATQERLYQKQVDKLLAQGYGEEAARSEAGKAVALPGTSEHQLGLAVDIVDFYNQNLNESQEDTAVQRWMMENSWKYGFILRYPSEKSETTGIIYEPWHYRYVGREAAKELYDLGLCLEEYLAL